MAERTIQVRTYTIVCAVLVLLTVLTVGISFFHLEGGWHIALGLTIAVAKATLVVLFFMQALLSTRVTWLVIIVSCAWLLILLSLTLADYVTRGMMPFTPGH
jgi:cytochrome c oxidase subunit 4